jgi:hypothetical protein
MPMEWSRRRAATEAPRAHRARPLGWAVGAVVLAVILAAGGSAAAGTPPRAPLATPTKKAKMVCAKEAQHDIAGVLAIKPAAVTKPTWTNQLYSCTYQYPTGSFTVSVKQLTDRAATTQYFNALGTLLNRLPDDVPMGDGAYLTANGSMVVRKDNNVLDVDAGKLPAQFSKLHLSPADVASSVAMTILGCWKG